MSLLDNKANTGVSLAGVALSELNLGADDIFEYLVRTPVEPWRLY